MKNCKCKEQWKRILNFEAIKNYKDLVIKTESYTVSTKTEGRGDSKRTIEYLDIVASFDIETSSFLSKNGVKHACMYSWQFGIEGDVYVGRTWDEFEECIAFLVHYYELRENRRLVVWVHNLPYEFQWICHRFKWENVFAREERSPMRALTQDGIEFRCSYILSGSSLAHVSENLQTYKVDKMVGDLDYKLVRGPETYLSEKELQYCINDVLVVTAYIWEQLEIYHTLTKIPMTNTGRVRNLVRKNCFSKENYKKFKRLMSSLNIGKDEYFALKRAFGGGFTHANYMYVDEVISDVQSMDFTSSYPTVMVAEQFPMSKATEFREGDVSLNYIEKTRPLYCWMFNIKFKNIRAKLNQDNPISMSKCYQFEKIDENGRLMQNNGRLMSAVGYEFVMTITDVDWDYIKEFYEWDEVTIGRSWRYNKGYLPTPFVETIISLYEDKTTLKDVEGSEVDYLLKKGMLNSLYGMLVMDIVSEDVFFGLEWGTEPLDVEKKLNDYNTAEKRFTFYPWGVWCTAYARRNLFTGIKELGTDYKYSDTDSVKFTNYENHIEYFEKYNDTIIRKINKACEFHRIDSKRACPETIKHVKKPLGVWDDDGRYKEFKTLGAKRYMVRTQKDEIKLTVAGVNKKGAAKYLSTFDEPFEMFTDKLEVPSEYAHKTQCAYNDAGCDGVTTDYLGNSFEYHEKSYVHMSEGSYNLTISPIYATLLNSRTEVKL